MKVVTVARKPCSASSTVGNVVEHEAGALNIDGARVRFISSADQASAFPGGKVTSRKVTGGGLGAGWKPHERAGFEAGRRTDGRWPPNAILVHQGGCQVVGERQVSTGTAVRRRGGGKTIFSETEKPALRDMTYADADGKETVPAWRCGPGCPVPYLDRQSGTLKSGSGTVKRSSSADRGGNQGPAYGAESRPDGSPQIWYGDEGGASRFFRQVKPGSEE